MMLAESQDLRVLAYHWLRRHGLRVALCRITGYANQTVTVHATPLVQRAILRAMDTQQDAPWRLDVWAAQRRNATDADLNRRIEAGDMKTLSMTYGFDHG